MTKKERISGIDAEIKRLSAAREAALDAIPLSVVGDDYKLAEDAIFNEYQPRIDALFIERIAATMPCPKNPWFLGAMADYIRKADENGGKWETRISARQVEIFARYASGIVEDGKSGRYPAIVTGADVSGHLIKISTHGFIIVQRYAQTGDSN